MVTWHITYTKQARKDYKKVVSGGLQPKLVAMIDSLQEDPFYSPPRPEKLSGDMSGFYSRRINIQHRLVYEVLEEEQTIKIARMWTHYE